MPRTQVIVQLSCDASRVSELIAAVQATAEALADTWRCPSTSLTGDLRCEQDVNHGGDRHTNGTFSWSVVADDNLKIGARLIGRATGDEYVVDGVDEKIVRFADGRGAAVRNGFWDRYRLAE